MPSLFIDLYPVGEPEQLWCDLCLKPSVVRQWVAWVDPKTLRVVGGCFVGYCDECKTTFP